MLARVAESLYWMGRYIERSEHCSRYLRVQYFSTLEAPMLQNTDFTLRSILFMSSTDFDTNSSVKAKDVWQKVIFDLNNRNSLCSLSYKARENARSIKNIISMELWENINKWHLYNQSLDVLQFNFPMIFEYTAEYIKHIALIKSSAQTTLLHNDVLRFLSLGIYVERAFQVTRITKSKISDSSILSNNGANLPLQIYQWNILLRSLEAYDIYNSYYKGAHLSKESVLNLILNNPIFERSIFFTSERIKTHLKGISVRPPGFESMLNSFYTIKGESFKFTNLENEEKVLDDIQKCNKSFASLHTNIEQNYFQ